MKSEPIPSSPTVCQWVYATWVGGISVRAGSGIELRNSRGGRCKGRVDLPGMSWTAMGMRKDMADDLSRVWLIP
jgi:hypothetical protein